MNTSENHPTSSTEIPVPPLRKSLTRGEKRYEGIDFSEKMEKRLKPSFDFILFLLISSGLLVAAFLTDHLAIFLMAILFAPLLTPLITISYGIVTGRSKFITSSFFGLVIVLIFPFLGGLFAGFLRTQFLFQGTLFWLIFTEFSWLNVLLVATGGFLSVFIMLKNPRMNSLVSNVAIVYGLFLPLGAAGFSLGQGLLPIFLSSIEITVLNILLLFLVFFAAYLTSGIHPETLVKAVPLLASILIAAGYFFVFFFQGGAYQPPVFTENFQGVTELQIFPIQTAHSTQEPSPTATQMVLPTLTNAVEQTESLIGLQTSTPTLIPTSTATITLTPLPTPVWAAINASNANGANIRNAPGFDGSIIRTLLNGTLVQVLPDSTSVDGITWVKVKLEDQIEGWVVRNLILSATPAPDW